jgi:hypothetical protein
MSDLQSFSSAISYVTSKKEAERVEWNKELGVPDFFIKDSEEDNTNKGMGVGFFAAKDGSGVYVIRRMANGYHLKDCVFYPSEFISKLTALNTKEAK